MAESDGERMEPDGLVCHREEGAGLGNRGAGMGGHLPSHVLLNHRSLGSRTSEGPLGDSNANGVSPAAAGKPVPSQEQQQVLLRRLGRAGGGGGERGPIVNLLTSL